MRRNYTLSDETRKVINGKAEAIAIEFGCTDKYIYSILSDDQTDPFAKFEWLFRSAVKAGCNVLPWIAKLNHIRDSYAESGLCHKEETALTLKEVSELNTAVITDKPLYEQLTEALDVEQQAGRNVKAIMSKINNDKDAGYDIRDTAKMAVSRFRSSR